jgi:predicted acyl esterase
VFTGEPLPAPLLVIGEPSVELTLSSSNPPGELRRVRLPLAPLAHRFAAGSRLRMQMSSGAHPLHLRNPGTEDPVRDFSHLTPSEQTVALGEETLAVLTLPVGG